MRLAVLSIVGSVLVVATGLAVGQAPPHKRLNPVIALLEQNKTVFGVYAPSNGRARGEPAMARPAIDLARDALAYQQADFLFSGSLEGGLDRGYPAVAEFFKAMGESAGPGRPPAVGVTRPMVLKVPKMHHV